MLKPTKFLVRSSIKSRLLDFTHHMYANGFNTTFDQVFQSLKGLKHIDLSDLNDWKSALRSIYCYNFQTYENFDGLFDSFWRNEGRKKTNLERQKNDLNKNKNTKSVLSPIEGQTLTNETTNDILNEDNEAEISNETKSKITASY